MDNPEKNLAREFTVWHGQPSQWTNLSYFVFAVLCFWLIVPVIFAIYHAMQTRNTWITLTNQRLRIQWGILSKNLQEMELFRVKDTAWSASFFDRLVGIGRIWVISSDRSTPQLRLPAIRDSWSFREALREYAEAQRALHGVREVDMITGH